MLDLNRNLFVLAVKHLNFQFISKVNDILLWFLKQNNDIFILLFFLPVMFVKWSFLIVQRSFLSNIKYFFCARFKTVYIQQKFFSLHLCLSTRFIYWAVSIYLLLQIIFPRTLKYILHTFNSFFVWFEFNSFMIVHFTYCYAFALSIMCHFYDAVVFTNNT